MSSLPTCIVADDYAVMRELMRMRLEDMDLARVVGEAAHCAGAVELIRQMAPALALVDLRMPGGSGLGVIEDLRASGCTTRLVLFSACHDDAIVDAARTAGADAYISKDLPGPVFELAVRQVLAGAPFVAAIDAAPLDALTPAAAA